jgi:hypothetical protein
VWWVARSDDARAFCRRPGAIEPSATAHAIPCADLEQLADSARSLARD